MHQLDFTLSYQIYVCVPINIVFSMQILSPRGYLSIVKSAVLIEFLCIRNFRNFAPLSSSLEPMNGLNCSTCIVHEDELCDISHNIIFQLASNFTNLYLLHPVTLIYYPYLELTVCSCLVSSCIKKNFSLMRSVSVFISTPTPGNS